MNKRIVIILICLICVIVPTVLLSAVFVVRSVDVVGIGEPFVFDEQALSANSGIGLGSSIFVLSEKSVIHNVERCNPDIKVVDVERIFPSKVVVNVTRRIPIVAVGIKDTKRYALVDRELRVVDIVDSLIEYNVVLYDAYFLDIDKDTRLGNSIIDLEKKDLGAFVLQGIIRGFEKVGYVNAKFPNYVKGISIDEAKGIATIATHSGASIEIYINSNVSIEDFTATGVSAFDKIAQGDDPNKKELISSGTFYFDTNTNSWMRRV